MNITFLIGNGFDVGVGLKSKFSDYFPIYIEESRNKETSLKKLADDIDSNKAEWSYFERQLGVYLKNFNKDTKSEFIAQLKDFETGFISYLKKSEKLVDYSCTDEIYNQMTSALLYFYMNDNIPVLSKLQIENLFKTYERTAHIYNFINFNYTSILENCLATIKDGTVLNRRLASGTILSDKVGKITHIHGSIDRSPIMGVNDKSQIFNKELAEDNKFAKYLIKPMLNKARRMNYDVEAEKLIKNSHIICVYGMSLGETDKYWWNLILRWLNADASRQLVIFVYDEEFSLSTQVDWLEKEDSLIDKLETFMEVDKSNIESLKKRIHMAIHKNIFEIKLVSEKSWIYDKIPAIT